MAPQQSTSARSQPGNTPPRWRSIGELAAEIVVRLAAQLDEREATE